MYLMSGLARYYVNLAIIISCQTCVLNVNCDERLGSYINGNRIIVVCKRVMCIEYGSFVHVSLVICIGYVGYLCVFSANYLSHYITSRLLY